MTDYTDDMPEKAKRYAENGATDREIADLFDVTERTLYRWNMPEKAKRYAENGATDREIADLFDVTERTLYRWKHKHPKLAQALSVGKALSDERVEQSLYKRAVGYSYDAIKFTAYEGIVTETPYVEHVAPDTTAAIFWLKNRKPGDWRDKTEVEHNLPEALASWLDNR